jgi:hypothetical protein
MLPLPTGDAATQEPASAAADKAKIHILESAVVTWTKQIKSVLKADPDAALKVGGCGWGGGGGGGGGGAACCNRPWGRCL